MNCDFEDEQDFKSEGCHNRCSERAFKIDEKGYSWKQKG